MNVINRISVRNDAYIHCKSMFYQAKDILSENSKYDFRIGTNYLHGEIDSGNWAISYLLSMYPYCADEISLFLPAEVVVNDTQMTLKELSKYTCYMDYIYPLFSSKKTVYQLVSRALKKTGVADSAEEIREKFLLDQERFERPLTQVGNEVFRMMAAIGYCNGKQVFCFPWLSKRRFEGYHKQITTTLDILESLGKIVIVPIGE